MTDVRFTPKPVAGDAFVGRSGELRELLWHCLDTGAPLVNLGGPSKIGRTSFLCEVARLAVVNGKGTQYEGLFGRQRLLTPLIDLGKRPVGAPIETVMAQAISTEMHRVELLDAAQQSFDGAGALDALMPVMRKAPETLILMLVDQAERLLIGEKALAEEPWEGGAVEALGVLKDAVQSFGVVFSFGPAGPNANVDAAQREVRQQSFLLTISKLLDLVVDRIHLGLLAEADVREFAERATVRRRNRWSRIKKEEVEWIVRMAGGHPFVMHRAGFALSRSSGLQDAAVELEESLTLLIGHSLRRIAGDDEAVAALVEITDNEAGAHVPARVAEALAGEGLALIDRRGDSAQASCWIPSPAVRSSLRRELERTAAAHRGEELLPALAPVVKPAPYVLEIVDDADASRAVRLSDKEQAILAALLAADPGRLISRDELLRALGPGSNTPQLTQRISVLRSKLMNELKIENPIENVYGQGYQLLQAERFRLRNG